MPRYRANIRFGPWEMGDEFESEDPFHEALATKGKLLTIIDESSTEPPAGT